MHTSTVAVIQFRDHIRIQVFYPFTVEVEDTDLVFRDP